jgi:Tol biopolymer transport system component
MRGKRLIRVVVAILISGAFLSCRPGKIWVVTGMTTIKEYGKSVDWFHPQNLIATARPLFDGHYDLLIFSMDDPDNETYLTHNATGAPQKHNGNPAWHPSGNYIVFTAENEDVGSEYDFYAVPGRGVNCNLWLATSDGTNFWQLTFHGTAYDDDAPGVIHPQFSPDGEKLFWAERAMGATGTMWGRWALKVARFVDDGDDPRLEDIQTLTPGDQSAFYESHAFSHDGTSVLFSGNLESSQRETGLDIYEVKLEDAVLTRRTSSFSDWDEHAHWSPDGEKIAWMSSTPLNVEYPEDMGPHDWRYYLATELWLMNVDGSGKQRLTFFNQSGDSHQRAERTVVSDSAWGPNGESLLVLLANADGTGPASSSTTQLVLITLAEE